MSEAPTADVSTRHFPPPRPRESRELKLRRFLHTPAMEALIALLIVASCVLAVVEIVYAPPAVDGVIQEPTPPGRLTASEHRFVHLAGNVITILFAIELGLRAAYYRNRRRFFARYWIDILASLPLPPAFSPLRVLRLLRLLRLLHLGTLIKRRFFHGAGGQFASLILLSVGVVIFGATLMALFERALAPQYDSFGYAFWWSAFSMISGEPSGGIPQSGAGRAIAFFVSLSGLCVFAVVTGAVAALMTQRLKRLEVHEMDLEELEGHIVICGWDRRAPLVIEELHTSAEEKGRPIVVVAELEELPPMNWKVVNRDRVYLVSGDFTKAELLEKAGVRRASKAIIMSDKTGMRGDQDRDARTILAALTIEKLNRSIYTCAELLSREHEPHLRMAGVEDVVCVSEYGATLISSMAIHSGLSSIIGELLSVQYGNDFFKLEVPPAMEGKTFAEAAALIKQKHDALLMAIEKPGGGGKKREMELNPKADQVLTKSDRMVVISKVRPVL